MRLNARSAALVVFFSYIALSATTFCFGAELIAPTRTLEEPVKSWGGLTVFSEPPQLEVYLDGEKVGRTPLWLQKVQAGLHTLRIASAETSVHVEKGKRVKIGLFKGTLVTGSEQEKEKPRLQQQLKERDAIPTSQGQEEREKSEDLSLWEKFVNGSLKHF